MNSEKQLPEAAKEIIHLLQSGMSQREISEKTGVPMKTITDITRYFCSTAVMPEEE